MRRSLDDERRDIQYRYTPDPDSESHHSSEVARLTEKTERLAVTEPHYEIVSRGSSSSSDIILEQNLGLNSIPKCFVKKPSRSAIQTSPRHQVQTSPQQRHQVRTSSSSDRLQSNDRLNSPNENRAQTSDLISPLSLTTPPPLVSSDSFRSKNTQNSPRSRDNVQYSESRQTFGSAEISPPKESGSHSRGTTSSRQINNVPSESQIPRFSEISTTSKPRSSSSSSGPKRQPLIIIPKSRSGRGRGNPQKGIIPSVPAPSISQPHSPTPALSLGRGRAAVLPSSSRLVSHNSPDKNKQRSRAVSGESAGSGGFYHSDFYGAGVTACTDSCEEGENFSSSARGSSSVSHKQPVSLCFAYDSDDPDNY